MNIRTRAPSRRYHRSGRDGMLGARLLVALVALLSTLRPASGAAVVRVSCRDGEPLIHSRSGFDRPRPFTANVLCDADERDDGRCVVRASVVRLQNLANAPIAVNTKPLRVRGGRSRLIEVDDHADPATSPGFGHATNVRLRVHCKPADR